MQMQSTNAESNHEDATCTAKLPVCAVVYLHGLNMDVHEEDAVVEAVERLYGDQVINIQPSFREGITSARLSIESQAKRVVVEMKERLRAQHPPCPEETLQKLPINIFGYSQGGLIACIVAELFRNDLNIKSITTAHSPLSGTDVLENNLSDLRKFKQKARPGLLAVGYNMNSLSGRLHNAVNCVTASLVNGFPCGITKFFMKGLADMRTNSPCTQRIKALIRSGLHGIPTLIIAGHINNLTEYFDFKEEDREKVIELSDAYSLLTTKKEKGEHDILIALSSQLCRTDSFENLASSVNDSVYPENIEIYVAEDELHCFNLMSMLSDFPVQRGKTLFEAHSTIKVFTEFLGKHNNLTKKS